MACTEQNPGETCKWGEYQVWRDSPVDHCYLCIHGSHWESKNQPRRRKKDKTMKNDNICAKCGYFDCMCNSILKKVVLNEKTYTFTRAQLDSMLQGTIEMFLEYQRVHGQNETDAIVSAVIEIIEGLDGDRDLATWGITEKTVMQVCSRKSKLPKRGERTNEVKPTIVCLCGSTRFFEAFQQANLEETLRGNIVLTIGCDTKSDNDLFSSLTEHELVELKKNLDVLHLRKIDLADEVYILNVNGYIGESTARELAYAKVNGKKIRFLEADRDGIEA